MELEQIYVTREEAEAHKLLKKYKLLLTRQRVFLLKVIEDNRRSEENRELMG